MAFHGGGNSIADTSDTAFIIAEPTDVPPVATPLVFRVHPPRPNPFGADLAVRYDLPEPTPVTVDVYDAAGRRVARLLGGGMQPAGQHRVTWNGADGRGRPVGSGIYFIRFITKNERRTVRALRITN